MNDLIKKTDGEMISLHQIKNIEYQSQELHDSQITVGDFLKELLCTLWMEEEGFSSKKPFGNSSWQHEIYSVFVQNKIISGTIDEYGDFEECDYKLADKIVCDIIVEAM